MTFTAYEASLESSQPIELYTISIGASIQRWTSAEDDITEAADVFSAVSISREKITDGGSDNKQQSMTLTVPGDNTIATQYINSVPGVKADVIIERIQRLDGASYEVIRIFEGRIESVAFEQQGRLAKIKVEPRISAQAREIPRFTYQGLCNHVLYDARCQVDDTSGSFRLSAAAVTAEVGRTITVTGADANGDGYYTGGFVESNGGADHRLIIDQTGTVLTLHLPFGAAVLATNVNVFAGCDHTIATCKSKFDNVINYGGFAYIPTKNPFSSGLD
tara:strand:- start:52859 stop:53686 length:828 start_codon:yes stop_codon:yes gene_type:complete